MMAKSPDETKKGLRCLSHDRTHTLPCSDCEYHGQGLPPCRMAVHEDAIALIQQLEAQNAEKDARIQQLETRVIHLEALNQSNLSVITMQDASEFLKELNELHAKVPRWISVEERLPEYDIDVLVCATGDFGSVITITSYSDHLHGFNIKGWVSPWQYFHKNYTITHWMPIPQPPEEE